MSQLAGSLFINFQQKSRGVVAHDWRRSVDHSQFTLAVMLSFEDQHVECVCSMDRCFIFHDVVVVPFPEGITIHVRMIKPLRSRASVRTQEALTVVIGVKQTTHVGCDNFKL